MENLSTANHLAEDRIGMERLVKHPIQPMVLVFAVPRMGAVFQGFSKKKPVHRRLDARAVEDVFDNESANCLFKTDRSSVSP